MHFAYPPRKNSNPPPIRPRGPILPDAARRNRLAALAVVGLGVVLFYLLLRTLFGGPSPGRAPPGRPPVVLVTVLDTAAFGKSYVQSIRENRRKYAEKHGYELFFPRPSDYDLQGASQSWTKVVALRHALTKFPGCRYVWYLDQDAYIMNPALAIDDYVMRPDRLESLMIRDLPVVPPDSMTTTLSQLKGGDVDLVVSQDKEGLSSGSFVVRNSEWAKFFLEIWFDPLYRSYGFSKAEAHALEHVMQWHPTILARFAIIPQRIINSYGNGSGAAGEHYQDGDLVVRVPDCAGRNHWSGEESCESAMKPFLEKWNAAFETA